LKWRFEVNKQDYLVQEYIETHNKTRAGRQGQEGKNKKARARRQEQDSKNKKARAREQARRQEEGLCGGYVTGQLVTE
jgi:hypothetical protein